jgi:tetratricopeptide (TPR) repeat protein
MGRNRARTSALSRYCRGVQRLYGRADVLERARSAVEHACDGQGRLLLFTGEPGIGKSRLAEHVGMEAAARGARVAWGRAWEAGGAPAYWPWIQIFRALNLAVDPFGNPSDVAAGAAEARFAAFERAIRSLRSAAAQQPLALVLDDLHAADEPSILLSLMLARELQHAAILVIGTHRDAEARATPALGALLAKLAREAEVLPLRRLSPEDVSSWASEAIAQLDAARAAELYRITEGHPLFVVEALRLGERAGVAAAWPIGPGVLDERLAAISPSTRSLLQVAAVLGRELSARDLAATAEVAPDPVFAALREALAASIIVESAPTDTFRFSHVLLRDRLYAMLAPSAREALHARAGLVRLAAGAEPESVIDHMFEGQAAGAPEKIAEVALAAAQSELSRLAFEDAARIGRRALALDAAHALPARLDAALRLVVAEAAIRLGDGDAGKQLCCEVAERAERDAMAEPLARAALVYGTELASGRIDPTMVALLRRALARLGGERSALRARVMARLAAALTPPVEAAHAVEIVALMRGASHMAHVLGDRHTLLYVLQFGATVALLVPEQERFAMMSETIELARALDQPLVLLATLPAYVTTLLAHGERERAEAELPAYDALLVDFRQPLHRLRRWLVEALLCALAGDLEGAERASEQARDLARREASGTGTILWLTQRLSLAQLLARPELVAAETSALLAQFEAMPTAIPFTTWLLAGCGRHAEALELLRQTRVESAAIPSANLSSLMGAAEAAVVLDEKEIGERLYPRVVEASDRMLWNLGPGALLGPTARVLGDLARCIGRTEQALRHYDEAIAFAEKLRSPPLLELCQRGRRAALEAAPVVGGSRAPLPASNAEAASEAAPREPVPAPRATAAPPAASGPVLRRDGELWAVVSAAGSTLRLKPSKGLAYLHRLMEQPGRPLHVLELAGVEHYTGDAGAVLDARAKLAYRQRLTDLREALAEAESFGDPTRAGEVQREIDALAEQLAQAVGLGGRDRRAASDVERTRVNIQRRLKDAIERIASADPATGRYLAATVETGTYCVYRPL